MGTPEEIAIVLTGGGARAAYQAGVLRAIAKVRPGARFRILTGTSAGGINAAFLANHTGSFPEAVEDLCRLWEGLDIAQVFDVRALALLGRAARMGMSLVIGSARKEPLVQGMLDTRPLREFLVRAYGDPGGALPGIATNLLSGRLRAVALTALRYSTGQTVTFFSGADIQAWERPSRVAVHTNLTVDHVMGSAALPFLFPAIPIGGAYYGDGGIRLVAPLAPALHLGASRVLALSTRYARTREEADRPSFSGPPSPAQLAGVLYNAIFHDSLDQDLLHLQRVNRLVATAPAEVAAELRPVALLLVRPSRDLGVLASRSEPRLPLAFRFLTRRLGTQRSRTQDFLSTVMFEPEYIAGLLAIGEEDGTVRAAEIGAFLDGAREATSGDAPAEAIPRDTSFSEPARERDGSVG